MLTKETPIMTEKGTISKAHFFAPSARCMEREEATKHILPPVE